MILRGCGCGANGWAGEYTDGRILSSPKFFQRFFGRCNLQGAIAFAEAALSANPAQHIATHHAAFSARAFCKLQLILRWCFKCQPHLPPRSPPRKSLSSFFCNCILQAAIDFAGVRKHRSLPRKFCACILQNAIDFAVPPILARRGRLCTH